MFSASSWAAAFPEALDGNSREVAALLILVRENAQSQIKMGELKRSIGQTPEERTKKAAKDKNDIRRFKTRDENDAAGNPSPLAASLSLVLCIRSTFLSLWSLAAFSSFLLSNKTQVKRASFACIR